jgi:hypothetical protein
MEASLGNWVLIQIVFDIFLAVGIFTIVMRMNRQPKDDPRLSRGLQLLQSKIAVLEDLSDRTEIQVNQLSAMLDQKAREVQAKVHLAEQQVHQIRISTERSLEVAKIFQDKIPHQEIIERQSTVKYVQAARLAHQGLDVEEIAKQVDLPKGEIEFITKVNRDRLMFNEEQLPLWAQESGHSGVSSGVDTDLKISTVDGTTYDQTSGGGGLGISATASAAIKEVLAQAFPASNISAGKNALTDSAEIFGVAAVLGEQAERLRAEMALAEQQRLVENLSRLQFEMQTLDIQLAKEGSRRDLSGAFDSAQVTPQSLQSLSKLGDEFRKACGDFNLKSGLEPVQLSRPVDAPRVDSAHEQAVKAVQSVEDLATVPMVSPAATVTVPTLPPQAKAQPEKQGLVAAQAQTQVQHSSVRQNISGTQPTGVAKIHSAKDAEPLIRLVRFPRIEMKP